MVVGKRRPYAQGLLSSSTNEQCKIPNKMNKNIFLFISLESSTSEFNNASIHCHNTD